MIGQGGGSNRDRQDSELARCNTAVTHSSREYSKKIYSALKNSNHLKICNVALLQFVVVGVVVPLLARAVVVVAVAGVGVGAADAVAAAVVSVLLCICFLGLS